MPFESFFNANDFWTNLSKTGHSVLVWCAATQLSRSTPHNCTSQSAITSRKEDKEP